MLPIPLVFRLARRLEATWSRRIEPRTEPWRAWRTLETHVADAESLRRRLQFATARNLSHARTIVIQEMRTLLRSMAARVEQLDDAYEAPEVRAPDLCDWIKEIRHLEAEFGAVEVRWTEAVLRVVTDPIELGGVSLGPFAIEFEWLHDRRSSSGSRSFRLKALAPNSPSGRDDITHPHVQDDKLCAGEAKDALEEAVAAGRLADAFLIVHSVLTTYNQNSPYVRLDEWEGLRCADCGRRVANSERSTCAGCDGDLCDECADRCAGCDETRCGDCLRSCDVCQAHHCWDTLTTTDDERSVCSACLTTCVRCATSTPKDELSAEGFCTTCTSMKGDPRCRQC
jgi:hypothetical protein